MREVAVSTVLVCESLWNKVSGVVREALIYTGIVTWFCIALTILNELLGG